MNLCCEHTEEKGPGQPCVVLGAAGRVAQPTTSSPRGTGLPAGRRWAGTVGHLEGCGQLKGSGA